MVPHALRIHKESGLNVVNCIDNEISADPELVIENLFVFRVHSKLISLEINIGVHFLACCSGTRTFVMTDVLFSE